MLIYTLSMFFSSMFAYIYQKTHRLPASKNTLYGLVPRLSIVLSCAILVVLAGTRVDVGADYEPYVRIFEEVNKGYSFNIEQGFIWLNQAIGFFTENPQWIFFISSLITLVLMYRFIIKYSVNISYSVFLYFGFCFIFFSFNTLRQFIAIAITLLAFGPLLNRRFFRYLLIILVASLFHITALVMIPLYTLLNITLTRLKIIIFLALAAVLYAMSPIVIDLFLSLYPQHRDSVFLLDRIKFSEIMILTPLILLTMIRYLQREKKLTYLGRDRIYANIVFFVLFVHVALVWIPGIDRVALYLDIMLLVIVPFIISRFPRVSAKTILIVSIIYFSSYAFISTYINDSHHVLPYKSTLMKSDKFEGAR